METRGELEGTLDEVSGHLNALHARLVDVAVAMLEQRSWWSGPGVEEPHRYLAWKTAISLGRAKQVVAIAERADELPVCVGRFQAGELSIDQMTVIARRAPWWVDEQIAELASMLTVSQLRRTLARYPFPVIPKPDEQGDSEPVEEPVADDGGGRDDATTDNDTGGDGSTSDEVREEPREEWVWFGWGDDGRFRARLEAEADTGLILEQALSEARDRLFHQHGGPVSWVEALRDIAERSLDRIEVPSRRDRFRIDLHLDTDGVFTDAAGRRLPDSIRRHLGCDGRLSPVFHHDAVPVSVGRTQRVIPPRLRRQVIHRDHGACRVPGCGADVFVEIHHIIHWEDHGPTEPPNLICLCPRHHRLHHRGELGITGDADQPDGITFTNRHGLVITPSGATPKQPQAPPPQPTGQYRHPLGEPLDRWSLHFTPPKHPAA